MKPQISTDISQSKRLLACGVDPETADMVLLKDKHGEPQLFNRPYDTFTCAFKKEYCFPAWSLSAIMTLLPPILIINKDKWWLDIAPLGSENQWSIGYYNMDKSRAIIGLTHKADLMECVVEEIEWLLANGYSLNKIEE